MAFEVKLKAQLEPINRKMGFDMEQLHIVFYNCTRKMQNLLSRGASLLLPFSRQNLLYKNFKCQL
jgi:hypothetical protein